MTANNQTDNRNKPVQLYVTQNEKKKIEEVSNNFKMTISEFVRQAIFDKINRIENPKVFTQYNKELIDNSLVKDLNKKIELIDEKLNLFNERTSVINEMKSQLNKIRNLSGSQSFAKKTDIILNLLKSNTSFTRIQLLDQSKISEDILIQIIANLIEEKIIEITGNGKFRLR